MMNTQAAMSSQNSMEQSHSIVVNDSDVVRNNDKTTTLDYTGLEYFHRGDSWWGCTVAFRALQQVAIQLDNSSNSAILKRDNLYLVSGHPGPGVLDAIDYVTQCITRKRFRLLDNVSDQVSCSRDMTFEWWISNGKQTVYIKLCDDFVPDSFYELLDRLGSENELADDKQLFTDFKNDLSKQLWHTSLEDAFEVKLLDKPMTLGELPHA